MAQNPQNQRQGTKSKSYPTAAYLPRLADESIADALSVSGTAIVEGPRACGKETSATQAARSDAVRIVRDWNENPEERDSIVSILDRRATGAGLALTQSFDSRQIPRQGRIPHVRMHTMSLQESGDSDGSVSVAALASIQTLKTPCEMHAPKDGQPLDFLMARGGWPSNLDAGRQNAGYYPALYLHEALAAHPEVSQPKALEYARTLAGSPGTKGSASLSAPASASYARLLGSLYLTLEIPSYQPGVGAPRSKKSPLRVWADPSLVFAAQRAGTGHMPDGIWEPGVRRAAFASLCYRDLSVYSQQNAAQVCYWQDGTGLFVDAIVQAPESDIAFAFALTKQEAEACAVRLRHLDAMLAKRGIGRLGVLCVLCAETPSPDGEQGRRHAGKAKKGKDVFMVAITQLGA